MKKKPIVGYPLFGAFPSDRALKMTKDSTYISIFKAAVPVNFTSEFRELFEATTSVTRGWLWV